MNPDDIVALIDKRAWIPLAALVIGLTIRLLKSDTKLPTIPPRLRVWAVFVLGILSGVLEHVVAGKTWPTAIGGGLASGAIAIFGHESIIASLRSGKELAIPGLIIPGASPSPGAPATKSDDDDDDIPTLRPPPPTGGALLVLAAIALSGCASATRAQARGAVLATSEAVKEGDKLCAEVALEKNDLALATKCADAYKDARASAIAAGETVDAWDEGKKGSVACAVKHAAAALGTAVDALRSRGVSIPKILDDARVLASALGGCT